MLLKLLIKHLGYLKNNEIPRNLKLKIFFLFLGILYSLFSFSGLVLTVYRPSWFNPPNWLIITFIAAIVPYFGCVLGFIGLGEIGHGGKSPGKIVRGAFEDIKNEYEKKV